MTEQGGATGVSLDESASEAEDAGEATTLRLARWTCTSGSDSRSRGAVVIESGDHRWNASAEGDGPVEALFKAVDKAIHDVLTGHPRLLAYDVHAVAEGPDAEGRVVVRLAPPETAEGERGSGDYEGASQRRNIIAASVEAYVDALNQLLAEEHWRGATESAGNRRAARRGEHVPRAEFDETHKPDRSRWFE